MGEGCGWRDQWRGSSVGQLRAKASVLASGQGIKAVRDELKANLAEAIEF